MRSRRSTGIHLKRSFSSGFYAARKELFFRFYKEVLLKIVERPPGEGFYALKSLQDRGLIDLDHHTAHRRA